MDSEQSTQGSVDDDYPTIEHHAKAKRRLNGSHEAEVNPHIDDDLRVIATESAQGIVILCIVAGIFICVCSWSTGFWGIVFHLGPSEWINRTCPVPIAVGIVLVVTALWSLGIYSFVSALKKIRRGMSVVHECSPYRAPLTILCNTNGRDDTYWILLIGEKNKQESLIVRTLHTLTISTAKKIDGNIGQIYMTTRPKDPIVIQSICGVIVCTLTPGTVEDD